MKIGVVKEKSGSETRVAITPDTAKDLAALGLEVHVQSKAGEDSGFTDDDYKAVGAKVSPDAPKILKTVDIILKVQAPTATEIAAMKKGAILVGFLANDMDLVSKYAEHKISAFAVEFIPRITRAQSMDALSSQSNLAGYKAVIDAVAEFGRVIPMMTTAAGSIKPAKALILGAGVAGLQAIATARRIGAIVSAFDVRTAAKEQVQSLGATFIEVTSEENAETSAGYAKEMSDNYKRRQSELIHETLKNQDIAICTALIPGKPAPLLITEKMVKDMQPGSIIVDLAVASGGNCELSELNKTVTKHGVIIIGHENTPGRVAKDASRLYARNLLNFIKPMIQQKLARIRIDFEDQIIQNAVLTHDGRIVSPRLAPAPTPEKPAKGNDK